MRKRQITVAAVILLSSQFAGKALASPSDNTEDESNTVQLMPATKVAQPTIPAANFDGVHAAGISVSAPPIVTPPSVQSSGLSVTAPSGIPLPDSDNTIKPLSVSPKGIGLSASSPASPSKGRAEVNFYGPDRALEIPTKFGTIHIMSGSLVLVIHAEDSLSIYDLHDGNSKAVFVESDGHKSTLGPGKYITLAPPHCGDFAAVNKLPFVAYTSADFEAINDGLVSFHGAYDINSLILKYAPFKQLLSSPDPKMRHVAENVLKTSAIMSQISANRRYYQQGYVLPKAVVTK